MINTSKRANEQTSKRTKPCLIVCSFVRLLVCSLLLIGSRARAEIVDQIAAVVEDEVITFSDLEILVRYRGLDVPQDPQERQNFYLARLEDLIDMKIIAKEAEQTPGIHVEPTEIDAQIRAYKARFPSEEAVQQKLKEMQTTLEDLHEIFRRQLIVNEFIRLRFEPFIIILPDQIEAYYRQQLIPELQKGNQPVPPLELVQENIRDILTVEKSTEELEKWVRAERRKARVKRLLFREPPQAPNVPKEFLSETKIVPAQ